MTADTVDKAIGVTNGLIEGDYVALPDVEKGLNTFVKLGPLFKSFNENMPRDDQQLPVKLEKLEVNIEMLNEKMSKNFVGLKPFVPPGTNIYEDIVLPISILTQHMMNCIRHPSLQAWRNFSDAYVAYAPLDMGNRLISLLNTEKTLESADHLDAIEEFGECVKGLDGLLGQLYFLEAFANGMNDGTTEKLQQSLKSLSDNVKQWKIEFFSNNFASH